MMEVEIEELESVKEKKLAKLNAKLARFMQNPRLKGFDAIVNEMDRLMPGQGIREQAEIIKRQRGFE